MAERRATATSRRPRIARKSLSLPLAEAPRLTRRVSCSFGSAAWSSGSSCSAVVFGATGLGLFLGRCLRHRSEHLREPLGVLQGALLGLVGLVLAFGLALAVGRYESRRAAVVDDANAIGTTYLRAQTLAEPMRTRSLQLLVRYTDTSIRLSQLGTGQHRRRVRQLPMVQKLQRELWGLAGQALAEAPVASAPRLYVETLNTMIDHADGPCRSPEQSSARSCACR